ncbi:MAG: hypothetical protein IT323_22255 [Anaerolineae bacterium]|nr:hypothetical protein [Anaerolineae bacterium]
MRVIYTDNRTEDYEDLPFNSGAQGELYLSKDKQHVVKLYTSALAQRRQEALRKIINEYNITMRTDPETGLRVVDPLIADMFAWPDIIVSKPRPGIRMRNVNVAGEHKPLSWWIGARTLKYVPEHMRGNWLDRTRVASQMARIAWKLHGSGLCHSDFSGDNFLAHVARHKVVLIDLDNLVVPDVIQPEILGTGDFMAPEIVIANDRNDSRALPRPSIHTDLHSLAVLIYQLLLNRHPLRGPKTHDADAQRDDVLALGERALYIEDPDDHSNRPQGDFVGAWALGEEVETLMRLSFTIGLRKPELRPLAATWLDALLRMADQIVPCTNKDCSHKAFVLLANRPARCPWCGTPIRFPKEVPILRLYSTFGQKGHFQPDRAHIVGWQRRPILRWHVFADVSESGLLNAGVHDRETLAEIVYDQRVGWQMLNVNLPALRVAGDGSVRRVGLGETAPLHHGQHWLLDNAPSARAALVTMQTVQ